MTDTLIVVPSYMTGPDDLEVLLTMLESLRATEPRAEVLVVDDASPAQALVDEIQAASERLHLHLHRKQENEGFSRAVNIGLFQARNAGQHAVLANADLEFTDPGWLDDMRSQEDSDGNLAWVVGARLLYPSGLLQHAGVFFSLLSRSFDHIYRYGPGDLPEAMVPRVVPVTGALQFIRHEALQKVGVYDEGFRMGFEDVDFCVRAFLAGGQCVYAPNVSAIHYESLFRGRGSEKVQVWEAQSWAYFAKKWAEQNFAAWIPQLI